MWKLHFPKNPNFRVASPFSCMWGCTFTIIFLLIFFGLQYAPLCKAILRDCPTMSSVLTKLDRKIAIKSERLDALMLISTEKDRARVLYLCERNRARIAVSQSQITECLQLVRGAYDKVKHALMWWKWTVIFSGIWIWIWNFHLKLSANTKVVCDPLFFHECLPF